MRIYVVYVSTGVNFMKEANSEYYGKLLDWEKAKQKFQAAINDLI